MTVKLLAFDGSGRKGSMNRKLLELVARAATAKGAEVTQIHLPEFNLPIYNGDLERDHGLPDGAKKLKEVFTAHDGFLIASPEYNGGYSALLKNAIDWVSRPPLSGKEFKGKPVGLMTAAPGKLSGMRGIYQLNTILFGLGFVVLPNVVSVGFHGEAFDESGQLKNDPEKASVETLAVKIVALTGALKA